jgi:hypothetical protein
MQAIHRTCFSRRQELFAPAGLLYYLSLITRGWYLDFLPTIDDMQVYYDHAPRYWMTQRAMGTDGLATCMTLLFFFGPLPAIVLPPSAKGGAGSSTREPSALVFQSPDECMNRRVSLPAFSIFQAQTSHHVCTFCTSPCSTNADQHVALRLKYQMYVVAAHLHQRSKLHSSS